MQRAAIFASCRPVAFGDIRYGARCAGVDLEDVDRIAAVMLLDRELDVHETDHIEAACHQGGLTL